MSLSTNLTADERSFAASAQGASHISAARHHHALAQRHKGQHAQPWTPAMEADVIRKGASCHRWGE